MYPYNGYIKLITSSMQGGSTVGWIEFLLDLSHAIGRKVPLSSRDFGSILAAVHDLTIWKAGGGFNRDVVAMGYDREEGEALVHVDHGVSYPDEFYVVNVRKGISAKVDRKEAEKWLESLFEKLIEEESEEAEVEQES